MDLTGFNADNYEALGEFTVKPKGWYLCEMTKSERPTVDGVEKGYMSIEFTVLEGPFKGGKIFDMCHLWNAGEKAQKTKELAQRQLATICGCVNVPKPADSSDLQGIPIGIKIGHEEYQGEPKERVKAYCSEKDFSAKAATNTGNATSEASGSTQETTGDRPW